MPKPSDTTAPVPSCPDDGKPGDAAWWLPEDPSIMNKLQFVITHGKGSHRGEGRNDFHYYKVYKDVETRTITDENGNVIQESEIILSRRANPFNPPDWNRIEMEIRENGLQGYDSRYRKKR